MKKWILSLIITAIIAGCATIPSEPEPHQHKFTIQILEIDTPVKSPGTDWVALESKFEKPDIENDILNPDSEIVEYPIIYAEVGVPAVSDKTKEVSLVSDYSVQNGKVKAQKEIQKLGTTIQVVLKKVEHDTALFDLNVHSKKLKGYDRLPLGGKKVKIPVFEEKQITTEFHHMLNTWIDLGALESHRNDNNTNLRKRFALKIIPPNADK